MDAYTLKGNIRIEGTQL